MPNFKKNPDSMKPSSFKMKGYSYPGTSPLPQGNQPHTKKKSQKVERAKGMLEDRIDLTTQNKKKIAELRAKMRAGEISEKSFREAITEIKAYVNPE